jgi:protein disulfide-isomerase A1
MEMGMMTDIKELKKYVLENSAITIDEDLLLEADEKMLAEAKEKEAAADKMKPDVEGASGADEDDTAQPLKTVTRNNFQARVLDSDAPAFIEFYAPWCGHCKKLAPIWDELGAHFEADENIVIAKIDMTTNELASVKVKGFPTIKLFKADNTVVDYAGGRLGFWPLAITSHSCVRRTLEDFIKYLKPEAEPEAEKKDEL